MGIKEKAGRYQGVSKMSYAVLGSGKERGWGEKEIAKQEKFIKEHMLRGADTMENMRQYQNIKEMQDDLDLLYGDDPMWQEIKKHLSVAVRNVFTTTGNYKLESDAERHFDSLVNDDFFYNEKEVRGRRLFDDKATEGDEQFVRIDRILHPKQRAIDEGWQYGPIAIEIKKSNMAIGPIMAQIFEYRQSIFCSKYLKNTRIMPIPFAIFPSRNITGDLHSLQETQYIFSCFHDRYKDALKINSFGHGVLEIGRNGISVGCWKPTIRKGHRGREK